MSSSGSRSQSRPAGGTFDCFRCDLSAGFDYYGRKPWFGSRNIVYHEDCYVKRDPFESDDTPGHLVLGSKCVVCSHTVCQACSVYYTLRFCKVCARANKHEFPAQMHKEFETPIHR